MAASGGRLTFTPPAVVLQGGPAVLGVTHVPPAPHTPWSGPEQESHSGIIKWYELEGSVKII